MLTVGKQQVLRHLQPFRWPDGRMAAVEVENGARRRGTWPQIIREGIAARAIILVLFVLATVAVVRCEHPPPHPFADPRRPRRRSGDLSQRIEVKRADELAELRGVRPHGREP